MNNYPSDEEDTLTQKSLNKAVKALRNNDFSYYRGDVFVENKNFYTSSIVKEIGFYCSEEELNNIREDGYIKTVRNVKLYLSKFVKLYE